MAVADYVVSYVLRVPCFVGCLRYIVGTGVYRVGIGSVKTGFVDDVYYCRVGAFDSQGAVGIFGSAPVGIQQEYST